MTDPDTGDSVSLTLLGYDAGRFTIADLDNTQMTLVSEVDLDTGRGATLTLTLRATDSGGLTADATVYVTINEV